MVEKIIPTETLIEIQSEINEELEQRKQSSESNQLRTDTERIDQLREMLYGGSIEVSDGLGLRRGWTDLRCALDNIL